MGGIDTDAKAYDLAKAFKIPVLIGYYANMLGFIFFHLAVKNLLPL